MNQNYFSAHGPSRIPWGWGGGDNFPDFLKPRFEKVGAILDLPCPSGILWFSHSVILSFCHNSDETGRSLRPVGQCRSNFI